MTERLSLAQAFWNRSKAAGFSDEQIRNRARREAGVIHHARILFFADGSTIQEAGPPCDRKLVVREDGVAKELHRAAVAG